MESGGKKRRTILGVKTTPAREGTDASHKRWAELMGSGWGRKGGRRVEGWGLKKES